MMDDAELTRSAGPPRQPQQLLNENDLSPDGAARMPASISCRTGEGKSHPVQSPLLHIYPFSPSYCNLKLSIAANLRGRLPMGNKKTFLPPDAVRWRRGCLSLSVCVSVTLIYCAQTTESIIMRPSPDCSRAILVFFILKI